jgi:hypothetical protein
LGHPAFAFGDKTTHTKVVDLGAARSQRSYSQGTLELVLQSSHFEAGQLSVESEETSSALIEGERHDGSQ